MWDKTNSFQGLLQSPMFNMGMGLLASRGMPEGLLTGMNQYNMNARTAQQIQYQQAIQEQMKAKAEEEARQKMLREQANRSFSRTPVPPAGYQQELPQISQQQGPAYNFDQAKFDQLQGSPEYAQAYAQSQAPISENQKQQLEIQRMNALKVQAPTIGSLNVGGSNLTPGQKKIDETFATEVYTPWKFGGYTDSAKLVSQLDEAVGDLKDPEKSISGTLVGVTPDVLLSVFNPEALDTREKVQEVVARNLKEILGGQFAQKEGENLMARAFNPLLPPEINARRVMRLAKQMELAAKAKQTAIDYFDDQGTIRGFKGDYVSQTEFVSMLDEWAKEDATLETQTNPPGGVQAGTEEDGYVFQGGDPADPKNWVKK